MQQKTAVEWLKSQMENMVDGYFGSPWKEIFEQAKVIEKEQIIKARIDGDENHTLVGNKIKDYAEQYYNETYNNKNK